MRRLMTLTTAILLIGSLASAQSAAPKATQDAPRAPYLGDRTAYPPAKSTTNIRLELTITDTFTGTPVVKAVSMVLLTGNSGMIRTTNFEQDGRSRSVLNVDANAAAYQDGTVAVRLTYEYTPPVQSTDPNTRATPAPPLNESITVVLKDGESMVVSESADPATDRKVTTELKATILK